MKLLEDNFLGRLVLPRGKKLLASRVERGNWHSRIVQDTTGGRSRVSGIARGRLAQPLSMNCFADPSRVQFGGVR